MNVSLADGLEAWPDIPEFEWASGVGTYTTTLTLPADWTPTNGATIDLGQVTDTVTMKVNGEPVVVNQLDATADLGTLLHAGNNELEVVVATTLQNRLAQLSPAVFYNTRGIQENGLVGPVVVQPYVTAAIERPTTTTPPTPTVPPVSTVAPSVDGTMKVGSVATCTPGTWTGATSLAYRWLRDGVAVPGETGSTLRLLGHHLGKAIACEVVATNEAGRATATSAERTVTTGAALRPTVKPDITGKARVGRRLSVPRARGRRRPPPTASRGWSVSGSSGRTHVEGGPGAPRQGGEGRRRGLQRRLRERHSKGQGPRQALTRSPRSRG